MLRGSLVAPCVLPFLLHIVFVSGLHDSTQRLNIDAEGRLSVARDGDAQLSMEQQGTVMRRQGTEHAVVEKHEEVKSSSSRRQKQFYAHHLNLVIAPSNATGQLIQRSNPLLDGGLKCNTPIFAPVDACPFECPFLAEDSRTVCHFRCLTSSECGSLDPQAKVADTTDNICRRCKLHGCADCSFGTKEVCRNCAAGFIKDGNGGCISPTSWMLYILKAVIAIFLLVATLWLVDLFTRKKTNWRGLKHGLAFRWRTRIHMPPGTPEEEGVDDTDDQDEQVHEELVYPLNTNLLRQPVAGPGLCLHMNFQIAVIIWSAVMMYLYSLTACMASIDMLVLGLTPAKTPAQLCSVIHWGSDAQSRLTFAKAVFAVVAYTFTFFGCLFLAVHNHLEFHRLDNKKTMKDFVAFCQHLPIEKGSANAEEELQAFVSQQTGQKVVGASICWNYTSKQKEVMQAIEADWKEREAVVAPRQTEDPENPAVRQPPLSFVRKQFRRIDGLLGYPDPALTATAPAESDNADANSEPPAAPTAAEETANAPFLSQDEGPQTLSDEDIKTMLEDMESSDCAFLVFETEESRDACVAYANENSLTYKGETLTLTSKHVEPGTARFTGLARGSCKSQRAKVLTQGIWKAVAAMVIWAAAFYLPYAYYNMSFSYAHGDTPPFFVFMLFSLLVVAGNQLVYFLADWIATNADFPFEDDREVAYNYIYVFACTFNVVLDLIVSLYMAYTMMAGMGVHTADDRLISSLDSFTDIFESYPIQKVFGSLLFKYAFPSCFFYPFVLEAIFTIAVPYLVNKYIVLSHDEIQGRDAELAMTYFAPMNMGRYGDIILNMILATMVLFCPGGFVLPMFLAFFFCHIGIYLLDHWRILRATPNFCYANRTVDFFGQCQLMMPTGILAGHAVYRFSQVLPDSVIDGPLLYLFCSLAFFGHCALHFAALMFFVPRFKPAPSKTCQSQYSEIAKGTALTWFSANPVHCLRSKYKFQHSPPSIHCIYGKEHLQKVNEDIGAHFEDTTYGGAYQLTQKLCEEEKQAKQDHKDEVEEDAP